MNGTNFLEPRGVQVELALAYLRSFLPVLKVWGISATLGNKDLAREILLGPLENYATVNANINKKIKSKIYLAQKGWKASLGVDIWGFNFCHRF